MTNKASKEKAVTGKKSSIVSLRASNSGAESTGGLQHGVYARSMPESLAAEAAVLGSMIIDPACISDVVEHLKTEAFYRIEHQMIFDALIALYEKNIGDAIDAVLLRDELEKRRQLEDVGGVEYLAKVMDSAPSSANAMYYAGIVKDKQLLRELIAAASEILNDAYSGEGEPDGKLDEAERKIFSVTDKNISG
ncbi:MAG: DnaB-like helicase N-terminal domain-containing protein, partial [Phycisphaerae bacterium]